MTKQSLVICHNAVGSIQAKNSEQATALAQCLGELEAEMQAADRGKNVVVMEPKKQPGPRSPEARRLRSPGRNKPADSPIPKTPAGPNAKA